ncbi:DEAD/DEAH box helicase [Aeromicrobium sp. Leaf350]|uniref:DEAD/DEAH box helicase n=1 Tax=Aeromicrobium sp. Leaf350 TaxID=2876565 RepID=UPI001E39B42E|nr:DEAD/DEAH box helicase [Aeromicrobium sp. Leaf350]
MRPEDLVARHGARVTHVEEQPAREAVVEPWPDWVPASVRTGFAAQGVTHLWAHQREAIDHVRAGRDVIVTTGTASGKSLAFQAPALTALSAGRDGEALLGSRLPSVLYLAPTKALAADQLRRVRELDPHVRAATVDGDNSREERQWARDHAAWVLTNPDTLHHVILPAHQRWSRLLRGLRMIVVDECHHYRGVFGAHVALVLRRLLRLCEHVGATPVVVCSSATVADPEAFARRLTGRDTVAVTDDASPRGARTVALWEPPLLDADDAPTGARRSTSSEAADLLADLTAHHVQTVCFVRSRRGAEHVTARAQQRLEDVDPELVDRVATYRGGYLPEERRALEARLRAKDLLGLTSTSALELGIDVSGLDAVVSVGFPGTRASLFQQWGRAGRGGQESLGVLIARTDPIDTYLVHHPEAIFSAPLESTVFDTDNPYVLGPHLAAAAHELPLTELDLDRFGPRAREGVDALTEAGWLRRRPAGWFWTRRERASDLADLRGSGGKPVQIVDAETGRLVGTVDAGSADAAVHEAAVYVHQGDTYLVEEYSPEDATAVVRRDDPGWTTQAKSSTRVDVVETARTTSWGHATISSGTVDVTTQVTSYMRRSNRGGGNLGEEPLDLPERSLRTSAVWWTLEPEQVDACLDAVDVPGAAHAAEHASIGLLPLLATCDRWDLGGLSTAYHPDTGRLTVFVHDGHPGGAGFAERGYATAATWLRFTRDTIAACPCPTGCPGCVQSPKCGNGNEPLDKAGAVRLLDAVLREAHDPVV